MDSTQQSQEAELASEKEAVRPIEIPDGGYGWVIVFAFFLYSFSTWGANAGYAIYLEEYLTHNTFSGGNKLDYAAIGGIALGVGLLLSPIIIWLQVMSSVQAVIGAGIIMQGVAVMLAAFSTKLWEIYLTQGLLLSLSLAFIFIPSMNLLPQWFRKKRSLATGIGSTGSGVGGIVFNLVVRRMIELKNVKWALIVQFVICIVLSTVALLLTKTRGAADRKAAIRKMSVFDKQVWSCTGMWLVSGWVAFTMLGYCIVLYSLSDFTVTLGYSEGQGAIVSCMIAVGWVFGRPAFGYISDRYGPLSTGVFVHLLLAIFCWAMWIPCRNYATAIVFALIQGLLMGTILATLGAIVVRVAGLAKMGVAFTLVWITFGSFGIVSPIIGLTLRSKNGTQGNGYAHTAIFCGFGYFGGSLCQFILRGYIIARDNISFNDQLVDHNMLDTVVPVKAVFSNLFQWRNLRQKV